MFHYQNGVMTLHSDFQMSNALCHPQLLLEENCEWERKYWEKVMRTKGADIPLPCMVYKRPFWRGITPPEKVDFKSDQIFVAGFDCKIYRVPYKAMRKPTDAEYVKYFKHALDKDQYRLRKAQHNDFIVYLVKKEVRL